VIILNSLSSEIELDDVEEIRWHIQENYASLRELELSPKIWDTLVNNFKTLAEIVS
jgi:hypothetical protein